MTPGVIALTADSDSIRPSRNVLVLGDGTGAFLSVIRSLGRAGLKVHVGWCSEHSPAACSRYIEKRQSIPKPVGGNDWYRPLRQVLETTRFDLVIATGEQGIRPLFERREELASAAEFNFYSERTMSIVFDKSRSTELAASLGVATPRSRLVSNVEELLAAGAEWGFPLVVKPTSSYEDDWIVRREVRKLLDREAASQAADLFDGGRRMLVQEHFWGTGVGVELLCDNGKILFAFQHERVHQPRHGGASSYRRSVDLDAELLDAARRIVVALEYTGVIMIEFLVDQVARTWRFVEINARFWGSLPLALAAGADFPRFYYEMLIAGRREFPSDYRRDVYCRNFIGDLKWRVEQLPWRRGRATTGTELRPNVFSELKIALTGRGNSDTFVGDDWRPGIAEVGAYLRRTRESLAQGLTSRWLRIGPLRNRAHQSAKQRFQSADSIAFVCYGNICRSPFAERYFRNRSDGKRRIESFGLSAIDGRESPAHALTASNDFEVCLSDHRARRLTPTFAAEFDAIVTFDEANYRAARRQFPELADRIIRFALLSDEQGSEIDDPYARPIEEYRKVYRRIARTLDRYLTGAKEPCSVAQAS